MSTLSCERPCKCKISGCEMAFNSATALKNHISHKHSDERPVKCNFPSCSYAAKTSGSLRSHMNKHSNNRPYPCSAGGCNFRAKRKNGIVRHVRCVHSQIRPFACSECNYKAALSGMLKSHMISRHSRRDFKCSHPQCQQAFTTLKQLQSHFSNLHGERNLKCDHPGCELKFANTKALHHHKWAVHSKKHVLCPKPNCSYRTNQPGNLARHMSVHERKEQKISRAIQDSEYRGKNSKSIELHTRRHENKIRQACPAPVEDGDLDDQFELHKPVKPFQCPLCLEHFARLDTLRSHLALHTNEKPFKCGHCEYQAARARTAKNHISVVHENIKFPFLIRLLDDRECLRCKVTMPSADFVSHCMTHATPVVILERMATSFPRSVTD